MKDVPEPPARWYIDDSLYTFETRYVGKSTEVDGKGNPFFDPVKNSSVTPTYPYIRTQENI